MNSRLIRLFSLAALLITSAGLATGAVDSSSSSPSALTEASSLLKDLRTRDFAAFVSNGTGAFKKITRQEFNEAASLVAPRLKGGFSISYMGELRKQNVPVTIWKIVPSQGDDLLATLSMTNGHVAGFWIHQPTGQKIVAP